MSLALIENAGFQLLLKAPDEDADHNGAVLSRDRFDRLDELDGFTQVTVLTGNAPGRTGWLSTPVLREAPAEAAPEAIDQEAFFATLDFEASRWGADRNHLFAVAVVESNVRNVAASGSTAFGPFQFLAGTWKELVERQPDGADLTLEDRNDPFRQCRGAAIASAAAIGRHQERFGQLPTGTELYMQHFLGATGGLRLLAAPRKAPVGPNGLVTASQIAGNGSMFRRGAATTVAELLEEAARRLQAGHDRALAIAAMLDPAPVPAAAGQADAAPWMARARSELDKGVAEFPGVASNPEIEKYFGATGHPPATDDVAWCGAFVAWCLANCGDPAAAASVRRATAASAADWLNWGTATGTPGPGTIAILRQPESDHVAFVVDTDHAAPMLRLLGGNQSNRVSEAEFRRSAVLGFRRLA